MSVVVLVHTKRFSNRSLIKWTDAAGDRVGSSLTHLYSKLRFIIPQPTGWVAGQFFGSRRFAAAPLQSAPPGGTPVVRCAYLALHRLLCWSPSRCCCLLVANTCTHCCWLSRKHSSRVWPPDTSAVMLQLFSSLLLCSLVFKFVCHCTTTCLQLTRVLCRQFCRAYCKCFVELQRSVINYILCHAERR